MRKLLVIVFCLTVMVLPVKILAQGIGINNPTPATSALLDLTSTDKGFLVPRMTSVERLAIAAPATGLLIYETTTNQFFYFDGVVWRSLVGDNKGWLLLGNSGTSDANNFIGTTDNVPLNFRVNNFKAGKIDHINQNVIVGKAAGNALAPGILNNVFIGDSAGAQMVSLPNNTVIGAGAMSTSIAGSGNTIIGFDAGKNNTGAGNVIIGSTAGRANTGSVNTFVGALSGDLSSGSFNSFFGQFSGRNATSGLGNTLIGQSSGQSLGSGNNNSVLGWRAGLTLTSGSHNTLLGDSANVLQSNLFNATAVGSKAMVGSSNSMVLGSIAGVNGATSDVNVAIGSTIANARLDVEGDLALTESAAIAVGLTNTALPIGQTSFVRTINPNVDYSVGGIAGGGSANGKIITIMNVGQGKMTIIPKDPAAIITNRIITGNGNLVVGDSGSVTMQYSTTLSNWFVTGFSNAQYESDKKPNIMSVAGSTIATATASFALMPDMSITFTPQDTLAMVLFSAAGGSINFCGQRALHFMLQVNGIPVTTTQTSVEDISNFSNKVWDISLTHPVPVTPGLATTIQIHWAIVGSNCNPLTNGPGSVASPHGSHRTLTVIETGGEGTFTTTAPPIPTGTAWNINGNAGTNSAANFIGTTDNAALAFRVNNFKAGLIDHINRNVALGTNAGSSPSLSGNFNVFVGDSAGVSNTLGANNTLIGFRAGRSVVASVRNTILGSKTAELMTGNDNVVIGAESALALTTASNNVIIGSGAAQSVSSMGNSNVLIGKSAPFNPFTTGSFNVVIGESAGSNNASLTQNNTIVGRLGRIESAIGGSTASDITILGANALAQDQPQLGVSKITLLGANTKSLNTTNSTAIGANAAVGGNNMLVLGSINGTNGATASVNVGIGTINPARRFHIANTGFSGATSNASAGFVFESNANNYMHLLIPEANETGLLFGDATTPLSSGILYNTAVAPNGLVFRTGANATRVTINAAGNVGIGNSNPTERLMVAGNIDASEDLYTGALNGIINCGGGNMNPLINMIADLTPAPLNANGDEDLYIEDDLELGSQGFKPGGGSWAAASDARLKKDVSDFTDGLQQVLQIRPVKFKYNDHFKSLNNGKEYIGVIAQEIKEVAPYTVELTQFGEQHKEDENGVERVVKEGEAFYSYDSSALTYMLINGMKEQQKEIEELKKQVIELRQQMNSK